jgi:hypothetical protein
MFLQWHAPVSEIKHAIGAILAEEFVAAIATTPHIGRVTSRLDENDLLAVAAGVCILFDRSNRISNDRITTGPSHQKSSCLVSMRTFDA